MSKVKILSILCVGLVLLNLFLIWFFVANKPHVKDTERQKIVIEKLHFNAEQEMKYKELIKEHRRNIHEARKKMMALKQMYYTTLKSAARNTSIDSLLTEIGKAQITIEQVHYNHFSGIKTICTQEQLPYFDSLTNELNTIFSPPGSKHEKH